jgi:hypothetical protein
LYRAAKWLLFLDGAVTIATLIPTQPSVVLLRDGELVLYRRTRSLMYQCRFKLADGKWVRFSTHKASLENAIAAACDKYDEARYGGVLDFV